MPDTVLRGGNQRSPSWTPVNQLPSGIGIQAQDPDNTYIFTFHDLEAQGQIATGLQDFPLF